LAILQSIFRFFPIVGGILASITSITALVLVFYGWIKLQDGIIENLDEV